MPLAGSLIAMGLLLSMHTHAQKEAPAMEVVDELPTSGGNDLYPGLRDPLVPTPLTKLPAGSTEPRGWLRYQLQAMAEGFTGRLPELSQWCRFEGSAWAAPDGEGNFGWEELPYWLKGYVALGYALGDERITAEARRWLDATLASQQEDGYFGPRENKRKHDLWPNMIMLDALRTFHEATADERVLPFMLNYCRWLSVLPFEHFLPGSWQKLRAGDLLGTIYWLHARTGEDWLLGLARTVHERTSDWSGSVASWHGVNICQCFREPAQFYLQTGDPRYLQATVRNYEQVWGLYGQVPGGMFGADENARPGYTGPQQAAETCSMAEFMRSAQMLMRITGNGLWADRCEDVAFNSLPASMTPDLKALHYLTAPNMVQLDRSSKAPFLQNGGNMLAYDPRLFRCCQHNVAMAWPYYSESLWAATHGEGLAAMLYAPCEVTAQAGGQQVRIQQDTQYPFGETVDFTLHTDQPVRFPLLLRVPAWCQNASVAVNGEPVDVKPQPLNYISLDREWHEGDAVRLELPMALTVKQWDAQKSAVSVHYGPLAFSLRIGEEWKAYWQEGDWSAWEVFPATAWNYGLALGEEPTASLTVVRRQAPPAEQPFTPENAPLEIKARGRRIPEWKMAGGIAGPLQESPARTDEPTEDLSLIPMGCARLRISQFPVAGTGPDAHLWQEPAMAVSASHLHDSIAALNDGILPAGSEGRGVPRFTWWDHRGTTEWIEYAFSKPRRVAWCEVYWFDDRETPGHCRVPASWEVLCKQGDEYKPVANPSAYGVEMNRMNRCEFDTVETEAIRLRVQLRPEFSGGVLEWRVSEE